MMSNDEQKLIVDDVERVAQLLGKEALGLSEYLQHGKYSEYQIYDGGRTWGKICKKAGIKTKANKPVSDDIYFERLAVAVDTLGRYPKTSERKKFGLNMSKRRYPTLDAFVRRAVELVLS